MSVFLGLAGAEDLTQVVSGCVFQCMDWTRSYDRRPNVEDLDGRHRVLCFHEIVRPMLDHVDSVAVSHRA
jgi:hypothetical protein